MSATEAAKKAGLRPQQFTRVIHGAARESIERLVSVCGALEIDLEWLFDRDAPYPCQRTKIRRIEQLVAGVKKELSELEIQGNPRGHKAQRPRKPE